MLIYFLCVIDLNGRFLVREYCCKRGHQEQRRSAAFTGFVLPSLSIQHLRKSKGSTMLLLETIAPAVTFQACLCHKEQQDFLIDSATRWRKCCTLQKVFFVRNICWYDIEIATMLHEKAATPFCFLSAMAFLSHSNQSHFLKEGLK